MYWWYPLSYLFLGPSGLLYLRVEMVVPALATLLPNTPLQVLGYEGPAFRPILLHQLYHLLVLLFGPGACEQKRINPDNLIVGEFKLLAVP